MKRRGISLPEVMVVIAVFSLMMVFVVMTMNSGRATERKLNNESDTYRMCMVVVDKVQMDLRTSKVTLATPTELRFRMLMRDASGQPITSGGVPQFESTEVIITMDAKHDVQRSFNGQVRRLGNLGPAGAVSFRMITGDTVELTVRAEINTAGTADKRSRYEQTIRVFLPNQFV